MNKETISDKQGIILVVLFIMGSTLVLGIGAEAKKDLWLAVILAMVSVLPILLIYSRLLALFPGKDLFDILDYIFGKLIGKVISIVYIWFALHLASLVLRNFGDFIKVVSFPETPLIVTLLTGGILCAWGVREGIEVLGRWGEFFFPIVVFIGMLTIFLMIPKIDINNIRPVLYNGMKPIIKGAFSLFTFPFAETIMFIMAFSSLKWKKSSYKVYIVGLLIGGLIILITALTEVLVLGIDIYANEYYPSYAAVSIIDVAGFIQRIEIVVSITFIIGGFIKVSICLLAATKGVAKVVGCSDYRFIVLPISLLMINLSYLVYENIDDMAKWAFEVWRYYAFPFQVIMPVIVAEIKLRTKALRSNNDE